MYERFTDRARKVMQLANIETQRFNHVHIGTEHILCGLLREGTGIAANVLKTLGLDLRSVRVEIEKYSPAGSDLVVTSLPPQTPRAKKVIERAIAESRELKHNHVSTEHLLLGLLRVEEGVAFTVILNLGLKLEDVRAAVLKAIEEKREARPPERITMVRLRPHVGVTEIVGNVYLLRCPGISQEPDPSSYEALLRKMQEIGEIITITSIIVIGERKPSP